MSWASRAFRNERTISISGVPWLIADDLSENGDGVTIGSRLAAPVTVILIAATLIVAAFPVEADERLLQ